MAQTGRWAGAAEPRDIGTPPRSLPTPVRNLVILLALVLTLSTWLSPDRYVAISGSLDRAHGVLTQMTYLALFVCVATQVDSRRSRQLLQVLLRTAVPICLLGLAQAAGWQPLPVLTDALSPLTTTLGRANFTGAYLVLLLPLALTAALAARDGWRRTGYGALVALILIVVALTRARAAWIAAVASTSALIWVRLAPRWSRRVRWLTLLGGGAALGGALFWVWQRGVAAGGSIAARWTIWQASLRLLWPRLWLGYGADTLELHFPSVYPPQLVYYQGRGVVVDRAHNWLLDWSLSFGIVATLILIGLLYVILREGWKRYNTCPEEVAIPSGGQPLEPHWLAACMAGICAHLVGNLFLFEVAATAVVFWLLLAIMTATATRAAPAADKKPLPLWLQSGMLVLGVLSLGWAVWQSNVRPLLAEAHSWRGTQALNQGRPLVALAEYAAAAEREPRRAAYHTAVALTAAQLGNDGQAEDAMHVAIALRPADPVLHTHLAAIYARQALASPTELDLAYGAYERAIALAPTIALTYRQFADLALRTGDSAVALEQALRAVDLDATDGIAFGVLGWAQLEQGNLAEAQIAFEQAVRWQPDWADFHLGLATVYFGQGSLDAARQAVRRSLILDPTYGPALALQSQLGDN